MTASLKKALIRAVTPRSFEYWGRGLGVQKRMKVQALQWSKHPLRALTALNPARSSRIERALFEIEGRILQLQEKSPARKRSPLNEKISAAEIFEHVLKGLNDGIIILGASGRMLHINQKLMDLTGYSLEESLGKSPVDFVRGDFKELVLASVRRVLAGENIGPTEVVIVKKDGSDLPAEFTASSLRTSSGQKRISVVVRDITERKQAEKKLVRSMGRYRELFESAPIGFHNLTPEGVIKDVNKKWLKLLGYTKEEVIGQPIFNFIVPEQRENAMERFQARLKGDPLPRQKGDRQYLRKDGSTIYVKTHDTVVRDNNGFGNFVQTSFLDITELRAVERREAELAVTLEIFNGVADFFSQIFSTFQFFTDPEFNGLNQIRQAHSEIDFRQVLGSLNNMKEAADTCFKMIELLRDYRSAATATRQSQKMSPARAGGIINAVLAEYEEHSAKIHLNVADGLPEIPTHVEWLMIALRYCLQNALDAIGQRTSKKGGYIKIEARKAGAAVVISLSDNGKRNQSLSLEMIKKLPLTHRITFMYMEQLKLATALKYVEALGGTCGIKGDKDHGMTFSASFPVEGMVKD